jgi:hypothetical protein
VYNEAIETLDSLVVNDIARDLSKTKYHKDVKQMIRFYRESLSLRLTQFWINFE